MENYLTMYMGLDIKDVRDSLRTFQDEISKSEKIVCSFSENTGDYFGQAGKSVAQNLENIENKVQGTWEKIGEFLNDGLKKSKDTFNQFGDETALAFESSITDFFLDAWQGQLKDAADYFEAFTDSVTSSFTSMLSNLATENLFAALGGEKTAGLVLAGAAAAGTMLYRSGGWASEKIFGGSDSRQEAASIMAPFYGPMWFMAPAIAQMLPSDWTRGIAGLSSGYHTKASGEREAFAKWIEQNYDLGLNRRHTGVFGRQGIELNNLQEQFAYVGASLENIVALADRFKVELGLSRSTVEDIASMLIGGMEEAGKTAVEVAGQVETLWASIIMSGKASFEELQAYQESIVTTDQMGFLQNLRAEFFSAANLVETEEQFERFNYYLNLISAAESGSAEAMAELENQFGGQVEGIEAVQEAAADLGEEYDNLTLKLANFQDRLEMWNQLGGEDTVNDAAQDAGSLYGQILKLGYYGFSHKKWRQIYETGKGSQEFRSLYEQWVEANTEYLSAAGTEEQLTSGIEQTQMEMAAINNELQGISELLDDIGKMGTIQAALNIDVNINPSVKEISTEGRQALGAVLGDTIINNEGGLLDVLDQIIDRRLQTIGIQ
jgi:hypothetical protein